jgi:hypothetical protein
MPGRRARRQPLNFALRQGRSASTTATATGPPTAERRAHVQVLRTLGIVGTNQTITAAEMKAFDDVFAAPIPLAVLTAIATLVDRQLPTSLLSPTPAGAPIAA